MGSVVSVDDSIIQIHLSGRLSLEDLLNVSKELPTLESGTGSSPDRLTDMTEVTGSSLDYETMEQFVSTRRFVDLNNSIRSAILAPNPLSYGLARMFQSLKDNPKIEVRLFKCGDEARAWLFSLGQRWADGNSK